MYYQPGVHLVSGKAKVGVEYKHGGDIVVFTQLL